ncbi:MAG: MmgE/PrpD family protein [Dehalococcoidia bacterium]
MGATQTLARFIADMRYDDLPAEVAEAAKVGIIDGVANMVAGSTQPAAEIIGRYTQDLGGAARCSVVGWGFKTNAPSASFANGVFGHCLDFEIQGHPPTHGTSSCLPAALALGEEAGVSGKTIIEAYVLGWEVQARLRTAAVPANTGGLHPPGYVGPMGGAAASARVLGLDEHHTRLALGIAASRTGGLTANTGTMMKSTHPGNAARMGAESAILARAGYTSNEDVLEAPLGYVAALFRNEFDWEVLTGGLGTEYRLVDPGFDIKRFPAQVYMQRTIEAVLNLRERHDVRPDMVETLTIETYNTGRSGSAPRSGLDGKFSIAYCASAALLDGFVNIDTFTDERRFSPDMEETLRRVQVKPIAQQQEVAKATALLKDGRTVNEECLWFRGSIGNPMDREERLAKFTDCVRRVLSEQDTKQLTDMLEHLEDVPDVSSIMAIIGQRPSGNG